MEKADAQSPLFPAARDVQAEGCRRRLPREKRSEVSDNIEAPRKGEDNRGALRAAVLIAWPKPEASGLRLEADALTSATAGFADASEEDKKRAIARYPKYTTGIIACSGLARQAPVSKALERAVQLEADWRRRLNKQARTLGTTDWAFKLAVLHVGDYMFIETRKIFSFRH